MKLTPHLALLIGIAANPIALADDFTNDYWTKAEAAPILEKTLRVHLSPSLDALSKEELAAAHILIEVGQIMQDLYEDSRHPEGIAANKELLELRRESDDPERAQMLLDL